MITAGYLSRLLRTTPMKTSYAFSSIHHVSPAILVPFVQVTSFVEVNKIGGSYSSTFLFFSPKGDGWWSGSFPYSGATLFQNTTYSK